MHDIWTKEEQTLLRSVCRRLVDSGLIAEHTQLSNNLNALQHQADALALYPSLMDCSRIGQRRRDVETLVATLSERYRDEDIFVMPTKALLGRSFEVGRINILYMVNELACALDTEFAQGLGTLDYVLNHLLSIMTEDVLLELLSAPTRDDVKNVAVRALAGIWESRTWADAVPFSPELRKMWCIRRESMPIFGTLLGTHEYMSLYRNVDQTCRDYILHASEYPEEAFALEEFLFGLSFEELSFARTSPIYASQGCIKREDVARALGKQEIYLSSQVQDPMELYRFYNHRRKRALSRWYARKPGPIRTFEEYFMAYLLSRSTGFPKPSSPGEHA